MAKRVILAVAGAGKTYTICHNINSEYKNLILAYTNENIHNINNELIDKFGIIPQMTNVMTFDSFIYRYILCPFEPTILKFFNEESFIRKGITIIKPPNRTIKINGRNVPNRKYQNKNKLGHYEINGLYYCKNVSELIMSVKQGREKLINKAASAINMFYDQIYIDEFQDFRKHDYELMIGLAKKVTNITLVGDYFQHSVSGQNNTGKPFKNKKNDVTYNEYLKLLNKEKFEVDTETLIASRRCSKNICDFVRKKLGININIKHNNKHVGNVYWIDSNNIQKILENDEIIKLVYKDSNRYEFKSLNWSYSKGDTLDEVCVILTDKFNNLNDDNFKCDNISQISINKLYVALTRTKGNLYLVKKDVFDNVKEYYSK